MVVIVSRITNYLILISRSVPRSTSEPRRSRAFPSEEFDYLRSGKEFHAGIDILELPTLKWSPSDPVGAHYHLPKHISHGLQTQ